MLLYLLFISQTLGIRLTKINVLSWSLVYSYEITKFANGRYGSFCCWFTDEIKLKYVISEKTMSMVRTRMAQYFPPFLSKPFTRVFQKLHQKSPDSVEFRTGIHSVLEIKLSIGTCDR